ncbi:MAG: hypothetical protein NUV91_03645, partial [Candidatus Omnitrophica bacterium]|nr:hypothetical protein [Candidatus Omnitrophota bacterium]
KETAKKTVENAAVQTTASGWFENFFKNMTLQFVGAFAGMAGGYIVGFLLGSLLDALGNDENRGEKMAKVGAMIGAIVGAALAPSLASKIASPSSASSGAEGTAPSAETKKLADTAETIGPTPEGSDKAIVVANDTAKQVPAGQLTNSKETALDVMISRHGYVPRVDSWGEALLAFPVGFGFGAFKGYIQLEAYKALGGDKGNDYDDLMVGVLSGILGDFAVAGLAHSLTGLTGTDYFAQLMGLGQTQRSKSEKEIGEEAVKGLSAKQQANPEIRKMVYDEAVANFRENQKVDVLADRRGKGAVAKYVDGKGEDFKERALNADPDADKSKKLTASEKNELQKVYIHAYRVAQEQAAGTFLGLQNAFVVSDAMVSMANLLDYTAMRLAGTAGAILVRIMAEGMGEENFASDTLASGAIGMFGDWLGRATFTYFRNDEGLGVVDRGLIRKRMVDAKDENGNTIMKDDKPVQVEQFYYTTREGKPIVIKESTLIETAKEKDVFHTIGNKSLTLEQAKQEVVKNSLGEGEYGPEVPVFFAERRTFIDDGFVSEGFKTLVQTTFAVLLAFAMDNTDFLKNVGPEDQGKAGAQLDLFIRRGVVFVGSAAMLGAFAEFAGLTYEAKGFNVQHQPMAHSIDKDGNRKPEAGSVEDEVYMTTFGHVFTGALQQYLHQAYGVLGAFGRNPMPGSTGTSDSQGRGEVFYVDEADKGKVTYTSGVVHFTQATDSMASLLGWSPAVVLQIENNRAARRAQVREQNPNMSEKQVKEEAEKLVARDMVNMIYNNMFINALSNLNSELAGGFVTGNYYRGGAILSNMKGILEFVGAMIADAANTSDEEFKKFPNITLRQWVQALPTKELQDTWKKLLGIDEEERE